MKRFRFGIGSLLILVVLLGVGFAALREVNDLWDGIVLSSAIGVLLVSVLLVVHRRAERRAFWLGFALFGGGYLGLSARPAIEPRLLTTRARAARASETRAHRTPDQGRHGRPWGPPRTPRVTPAALR